MNILRKIRLTGVIPLIGKVSPAEAGDLARALDMGGIPAAALRLESEKDTAQARAMREAVPGFIVCAYGSADAQAALRAAEAGVDAVFTDELNEEAAAVCARRGVTLLPLPSVVRFERLGQYFSSGLTAACVCPDLDAPEPSGKPSFETVVRRAREAVHAMLGFDLRHVGINRPDAESSARTVGEFESLFGFPRTDRGGAYFAGEVVEVMKKKFYGEHGHIAISTNDAARAAHFLQKQGAAFNWDSAGYEPDGRLRVVYLAKEVGGFAVHILQK